MITPFGGSPQMIQEPPDTAAAHNALAQAIATVTSAALTDPLLPQNPTNAADALADLNAKSQAAYDAIDAALDVLAKISEEDCAFQNAYLDALDGNK